MSAWGGVGEARVRSLSRCAGWVSAGANRRGERQGCPRRSNLEQKRLSKMGRQFVVSLVGRILGSYAGEAIDAFATDSVAGALEGENVGVVNDPVNRRGRDGLVSEDTAPTGERQVRGQDQWSMPLSGGARGRPSPTVRVDTHDAGGGAFSGASTGRPVALRKRGTQ